VLTRSFQGKNQMKFAPDIELSVLRKLAGRSANLTSLFAQIETQISARPPFHLGFPGEQTQTMYYLGPAIKESEVAQVSKALESRDIQLDNTRIRKTGDPDGYDILVASVRKSDTPIWAFPLSDTSTAQVRVVYGDHATHLERVCAELSQAIQYASNDKQAQILKKYMENFETGNLDAYLYSQRLWVRDELPRVENVFGFVDSYRDPLGTRAEFEGIVGIQDEKNTAKLTHLVENAENIIRRLPWTGPENDGRGLFEEKSFELRSFSSIHG
jgi:dipeptidyl-peptidase III